MDSFENDITPDFGQASYLMSAIVWQESLFQAYRNYLLIIQSIFLAISIGLLSVQSSSRTQLIIYSCGLAVVIAIGILTLKQLSSALQERSKAVDWWQRKLLTVEKKFSSRRHFAGFRIAKEHGFSKIEVEDDHLTTEQIDTLLRAEQPKARKLFDRLIIGLYFVWIVLCVVAAFKLYLKW